MQANKKFVDSRFSLGIAQKAPYESICRHPPPTNYGVQMTAQSNPFLPAIEALEVELVEKERSVNALLSTINILREKAGMPPRHPSGGQPASNASGSSESGPPIVAISHDTFYGKKMGTAARELLEMRRGQGNGPAKAREIFDCLVSGGFQFNTKDDSVAIISLRNMLTKNTAMFHKLPNGTFGLKAWYPNAKPEKAKVTKAPTTGAQPSPDAATAESSDDDAAAA